MDDALQRECRLLRRLARLFRAEREGALARRPVALATRLIERRGLLIDQLLALERGRRDAAPAPELRAAARALAAEIGAARRDAETRIDRLRRELRALGGEGAFTGMRNLAAGRVIGRG